MIRAATEADAQAAAALIIAVDVKELGEADYTLADLQEEWADSDAVVAEQDGTILGCAHFRGSEALAVVDPRREGEGAGSALHEWVVRRARERGETKLQQYVGAGGASARAFLEGRGYERVRSYWRMERDVSPADEEPDGLRALAPGDGPELYTIREAAFAGRPDFEPAMQEDWIAREVGRSDPALTRVAARGFALARPWEHGVVYIPLLGVHPDAQGRGLGTALLKGVFSAAGRAGHRQVQLSVASDNPNAIRLYERVGMTVRWRADAYERPLPD